MSPHNKDIINFQHHQNELNIRIFQVLYLFLGLQNIAIGFETLLNKLDKNAHNVLVLFVYLADFFQQGKEQLNGR
jgi:hypothetical protein